MKNKKKSGKEGVKGEKPLKTSFRFSSKCFFLTYKGISDSGERITKESLANYLVRQNPYDRKVYPEKYLICEQTYQDGAPHFHAILVYPRRKEVTNQTAFDYLGIHPNIQTMRNMKAALTYVHKQDSELHTNMDLMQQQRVARAKDSSSLYQLLEEEMNKDPFNFDVKRYLLHYNLAKEVYKANYSKAVHLLTGMQQVTCNKLLTQKPGFKLITRQLIQSLLSPQQLLTYDSWSGYQTIVTYLNQIVTHGGLRKMKTKNLLITGPASIGKTSLFHNPNHDPHQNPVQDYLAVYPMGMSTWFPQYRTGVYKLILWNEAKLTSYAYDTILKLLEGSYLDLPIKGGVAPKRDNPLIVMTSNMTLDQMIQQKFHYNKQYIQMARKNLAVRVQNVIVPDGLNLFLLQKLLTT